MPQIRARFDLVVPCVGCGATWDVEVVADVEVRGPGDATVADRQVWGILRGGSRDTDCGCECAPRDAHGLMAARNSREHGDEVEAAYFDAAEAAARKQEPAALRPAA